MYDTTVTIVGNAITMPEWRRLEKSNVLVAHFKVASHSRRYDRIADRWTDGNSLRVRVNCWRRLAEGVASSVKVGDPVIVRGRLYTRDWTTEDGQHRVAYELDAVAIGHDLSRGTGTFERTRMHLTTSAVEDGEADARIRGEASVPVSGPPAPGADGEPDVLDEDPFGAPYASVPDGDPVPADLHDVLVGSVGVPEREDGLIGAQDADGSEPDDQASPAASGRRGRIRDRHTVSA
jgi:single-strand DNA-binding protein